MESATDLEREKLIEVEVVFRKRQAPLPFGVWRGKSSARHSGRAGGRF
jgi:hypothetical protein